MWELSFVHAAPHGNLPSFQINMLKLNCIYSNSFGRIMGFHVLCLSEVGIVGGGSPLCSVSRPFTFRQNHIGTFSARLQEGTIQWVARTLFTPISTLYMQLHLAGKYRKSLVHIFFNSSWSWKHVYHLSCRNTSNEPGESFQVNSSASLFIRYSAFF